MEKDDAPEPTLPEDPDFLEIRQLTKRASLETVDRMRALLEQAVQQDQPWHRAFALAGLALTHFANDSSAAVALASEALPLMQALKTRVGLSTVWRSLGVAHRERGEMNESLSALEKMLQLERELGDPVGQARALSNLANTFDRMGRRATTVQCLEEALSLLPAGQPNLDFAVRNNLAAALANCAGGDREDGLPRERWQPQAERAVAFARGLLAEPEERRRELLNNPNYPMGCLAKALVVLDELDEALPMLQGLEASYTAAADIYALLWVRRELALAWLRAGRPEQTLAVVETAMALARERRFDRFLEDLWSLRSRAEEALGQWQSALRSFQAYHRLRLDSAAQMADEQARRLAVALGAATPAEPLALLLIDLDHFKAVNDRNGHAHGDQALALLGQQLQHLGRPGDQAARLGGDEFAWLGAIPSEQALKVAQRLQQVLRAESLARWPDQPPLTLSIGLAATHEACPAEALLKRADVALYAAKAQGRDGVRCG